MREYKWTPVGLTVLTSLLVVLASSCAAAVPAASTPAAEVSEVPSSGTQAVLDIASWMSVDYEPVQSNAELQDMSQIVVRGIIVEISTGPQIGFVDDELSEIPTAVVEIKPTEWAKGDPDSTGASIFLNMIAPSSASEFAKAVPAGTGVVLYGAKLDRRAPAGSLPMIGAEELLPRDKDIVGFVSPEGLVLEMKSNEGVAELVWPATGEWREADLNEAMPSGSLFNKTDK